MRVTELITKAQEITGLADLGDPAMLEGLEMLVRASNEEARLSEAGAQRWEASLVNTLANRLRIVDYLKHHPDLLERPIERPMFVFGLPAHRYHPHHQSAECRSGTTLPSALGGAQFRAAREGRRTAHGSAVCDRAGTARLGDQACSADRGGSLRGRGQPDGMPIRDGAVLLRPDLRLQCAHPELSGMVIPESATCRLSGFTSSSSSSCRRKMAAVGRSRTLGIRCFLTI